MTYLVQLVKSTGRARRPAERGTFVQGVHKSETMNLKAGYDFMRCRRRGEREAADQRILGDGDFVNQIITGLDDLVKKNLRLSGQRIDIKELAKKVCEKYDVSVRELRSGSRRNIAAQARRAMSWIRVKELGYSGADAARYLGVTNSCVTRMLSTGVKPGINDIVLEL
ncbi:MAG: hypothetical protein U9R02_08330 [Thermodesulfobacteriota bacterium]|nr:hypothetical protein [Thermodesulfobacteriota bacterium]